MLVQELVHTARRVAIYQVVSTHATNHELNPVGIAVRPSGWLLFKTRAL